ncbi:polyhydroxybutyrate depolymerase [Frankia sp. AiPs1]|uniref:alpha/beta hydrolase family esterase n=1 Tax=Frankia sp. AiPa1 TaxID=573492 RepID=UPI00202ADF70|nr:plasmid partitioning protein [Frankia sp. AiPa1]MCL9761503.1 plasmid partitioning protein [Frankia sp. AiPa1]
MVSGSPPSRHRGSLRHRTRTSNTVWLPIVAALGVLLLLLWYAMSRGPGPAKSTAAQSRTSGTDGQRAAAVASPTPTPTVPPAPASGCVTGKTLPSGTSTRTLQVAGVQRTYVLAVPARAAGSAARPLPLIVNYHDLDQSPFDLEAYTHLADQGTKAGFVVAVPVGERARWNFSRSVAVGPDDVLFTGLLLNELTGRMCLDAGRIFAAGYGDGANMVLTALCALPDRFAAAVTVASSVLSTSCARPTTSLLEIHGAVDPIAPLAGGGAPRAAPYTGIVAQAASDQLARYASALGCSGARSTAQDTADWSRTVWAGCPDNRDVGLIVMRGGGHTWPGAQARADRGPTSQALSGTVVVLTFFGYTPSTDDVGGGTGGTGGTGVPGPSVAPQAPGATATGGPSGPSPAPTQSAPGASGSASPTGDRDQNTPSPTDSPTPATPSATAQNGPAASG